MTPTPDDALPAPEPWMQLPAGQQCGVEHPTGIARCGRGPEHGDWHSDPRLRLTWRRYDNEPELGDEPTLERG